MKFIMHKVVFSLALFLLLLFVPSGSSPADEVKTLRVLTYNIHIGIGKDNKLDLERTARVISEQKPDMVALQEVDKKTHRTRKVDQAEELARLTKMNVVFGKTIDHQGGEYGIAILSRFPIKEHQMTQLPEQEDLEERGVLSTTIEIGEKTSLRFLCTHFCHKSEKRRVLQAKKINELFAGDDIPSILCGDMNAEPHSPSLDILYQSWEDATDATSTFPGDRKIDYILYRPKKSFKVVETKVIDDKITSDHSPVLSILELL